MFYVEMLSKLYRNKRVKRDILLFNGYNYLYTTHNYYSSTTKQIVRQRQSLIHIGTIHVLLVCTHAYNTAIPVRLLPLGNRE